MYLTTERKKRRCGHIIIALLLTFFIDASAVIGPLYGVAVAAPSTRMIVDRTGKEVCIPTYPKRVACLFGPSYEKLLSLGAVDRVAIVPNLALPWNYQLNPGLKQMPVIGNYAAPSMEQLMSLGVDLVIYHPFAKQIEQMKASGLPVVVAYDGRQRLSGIDEFIADWYAQIRFYGNVLGGSAKTTADEYCRYMHKRIQPVLAFTRELPASQRPRVFYICGKIHGNSNTQSRFSTAYWLVETAGGRMLTHDDAAYFINVTTEELIAWDPEIIIVGTAPSTETITKDPRLQSIAAVKTNRVVISPEGQFYWSHFSSESFLCILFLAKQFHPDQFAHIDLMRELKSYYNHFYHYSLTDDEAQRILNHLPPAP
jgi:iron complex transport system substrate-binding protein